MDYVTPAMISVLKDAAQKLETKSGATRDVLERILEIAYGVSVRRRKKIEIYISQERLVSELGWKKITIKRALRRLVQLGILLKVQQRRRHNGFFSTNLYHIVWDRLAEVLHVWSKSETVGESSTEELTDKSRESSVTSEERLMNTACESANCSDTSMKPGRVAAFVQRVTNCAKDRGKGKHNPVGAIDAELIQTIIQQYNIKNSNGFERWVRQNANRNVEKYLQWIQQCPANHAARPKNAWAWLRAAVRDQWDVPSWITPPSQPSVTYKIVDQPLPLSVAEKSCDELETEWTQIDTFLKTNESERVNFLHDVRQYLTNKFKLVGPWLENCMQKAETSPTWKTGCREVWRQWQKTHAILLN